MYTTSVALSTEETSPIFTFAGDTSSTTTTDSYGFADTHSVYSNPEGPLSSMITGIEGNELLRILSQQEPRVADTAPTPNYGSTAEMEDFWTNYRMNRSEMSANDDGSSVNNYFAEYNRGDGLPSGAWSDVNLNRQSSRQNDLMDSFDFLIKSLSSANNYVSMLTREQLAVLRAIRPSLLYELLQEVAKARSDRRIRRALPTECAFCKNNGENEECYTQHALKDWRGRVLCPVLRAFHCPRCGATGDRAHTIKYCPEPDLGGSSLGSRRRMPPSTSLLLGEPSGTTRPLSTPAAPSTTPVSSPVNGNLPYSTLWSNFNNFDKK